MKKPAGENSILYQKKIHESKGNYDFKQICLDPISRQTNRVLISVHMNYSKAKPTNG